MIRVRRSTTFRSCVIGLSLTLLVVILDGVGGLGGLERSLYDWRALHFQYFTPPPTDRPPTVREKW